MSEPRRVLIVTNIPTPYRLPLFRELSGQLATRGLALKVVFGAMGYRRRQWQMELESCGFDYEVLPGREWRVSRGENPSFSYAGLGALIRRDQPAALVVVGYSAATVRAWIARRAGGVPYVIWSGTIPTSPDRGAPLRGLQRRLLVRGADATVAYGSHARDYLCSLGADPTRCFVAINTVDTEFFATETARFRKQESQAEILWVGDLTVRKGVDLLVKAFAVAARARSDVGLVLVGDGPELSNLRSLVDSLGVTGQVRFEGFRQRSELPEYMARARGFAFPTRFDIWGLVLPEAMAAGLPCVSSIAAGSTHDLIEDGATGFRADFADTAAAGERLAWLLDHPVEARRIGAAAAEFVRQRASLKVSAGGLVRAIETAIARRLS